MLHFHFLKQSYNFRHKLEIIFKQLAFEHSREILRNLLAFLETTLQIVCNLSNVRHVVVLRVLVVLFCELELHFISQEELYCEVHDFLIFLRLKVVVIEHVHTATNHQAAP